MSKKVPPYIANQYGGASEFRRTKRMHLRELERAYSELRTGCAIFPGGTGPLDEIQRQLNILTEALSVKTWGR